MGALTYRLSFFVLFAMVLDRATVTAKICGEIDIRNYIERFERLRNCTTVLGSVQIVLLDDRTPEDFENVSFPELVEINGNLLLYQVSGLKSVGKLFPNLKVIHGKDLFLNYAITIHTIEHLEEIGLTKLRHIARGSIRIDNCPHLCHVNTTDWSRLGPGRLDYYNINPSECKPCPERCNGYCWNEHTCQSQIYTNCHEECLVCDSPGTGLDKCAVCKHHSNDGKCVSKCPYGKYSSRFVTQCLTEDECKALPNKTTTFIFRGECVHSCPLGYQLVPNKTDECQICDGYCVKYCNSTTVNSISSLQQIKGCTNINGSLIITLDKNLKQIVDELEDSLGEIRVITGQLKIQHTHHIKSLSFLKNLKEIRGEKLAKNTPILTIVNNYDLHTLFDLKKLNLLIAPGKFSIHYNPQLCLSEIKALAVYANRVKSYDNNIEVSSYSNGDQAACNIVDLNIKVINENATAVNLTWNNYEKMSEKIEKSEGKLGGYWIYYKKYNGDNITIYNSRDACDVDGWNTMMVDKNHAILTNLQPFTDYAFYIKTFTNDAEARAETNIQRFRTLSDDPTPPADFKITSTRSDTVFLSWKPPESPNGILDRYILIGYIEKDNLYALDNRNFCNKTVNTPIIYRETEIVSEPPVINASCSCGPKSPSVVSPSLENMCYSIGSDRYITMDMSESCQRFKYNVIEPIHSNISKRNDMRNHEIETYVPANETSREIRELEHFTLYVFLLSACNRPELGIEKQQCSAILMEYTRTLKDEKADDIPGKINVEVSNNNVTVFWREPTNPNGAIVTYNVEFKRTDSTHARADVKCITRKQHVLNRYIFRIMLEPGVYVVRVQAVSLAGPGNFTLPVEFSVEMSDKVNIAVVIIGTVIGILCLGFVLYGYYWYKKRMSNVRLVPSINPDYMYVEDEWEMDRNNIEISKELGQGSFGLVYSGFIKSQNVPCAVKTVNENFNMLDRMEFLNEASVMKFFNDAHHVVRLLGVVSRGQPPLVIMELMARGDLKTYLRRSRESSHNITCAEMYRMAAEIADGMAYLAAKKYIHRDLAARNCMVSADYTVKIGDFGMARDIYETDYYRKGTTGLLPVRWMAPESLADGVFTSDSDVWSYGVVLWEMVTLAEQPYQGLANEQVLQYVVGRGTLVRPVDCPDLLYEIMDACWKWKPNDRPLFTNIVEKLESHIGQDFRLVSFYHSREGEEYRMNTKERVYNAPALSVAAQTENFAQWNASDDEVSLYSGDANRPNKFLSFPHQRHSRSSPSYHLENSSPTNPYTTYSLTSM